MATTKVTMKLEGFEALQRAIARAPELVRAHASDAISTSAFAVARRMRTMAPMASGDLRRAIEASSRGLSGRVAINASAPYWRFLEYGTVNMAARPFIRPAAELETADFLSRMRAVGTKLERDWSTSRFA